MADNLPKFIVIRVRDLLSMSNAYYMTESDKGAGYVSCAGGDLFDTLAKIEVERSEIDSKYIHLRFSYTNKYWARRGDYWILATSDQPEEDVSKSSCTLFEPTISADGLLYLTHVQSGGALRVDSSTPNRGIHATTGVTATGFSFVDADTLLRLPNRVVFKGDNGKYLKAFYNGWNHLQYGSSDDADQYVAQEVVLHPSGHVRIKNDYFGKFWWLEDNTYEWILVNADDDSTNISTLFWPIKVDGSTIALRAARNNRFCKRLTADGKTDCLSASAPTIDRYARMIVEEPVLQRNILNLNYRLADARVYDARPFIVGSGSATNNTNTEATMTILMSYESMKSSTFSRGFSITTGVSTTIQAGIPFIAGGEIEVSVEVTGSFQWDTTTEETTKAEASYTVTVPPRSRVVVDYVATNAKCSVPFSYTQRDSSSIDGQIITSNHADGIFSGVNYYDFRFEQHEALPMEETDLP